MQTRVDRLDMDTSCEAIWTLITTPERLREFSFGLTFESSWAAGDALRVRLGPQTVAEGAVVVANAPRLLVYRLDEPGTGDVDYWVTWQLESFRTGCTRVCYIVDALSGDPPDHGKLLLLNLRKDAAGRGQP